MNREIRKFTPAIYILVLVCFFLPFTHISCQGTRVASLTGIQLVTGTTIEEPTMFRAERGKITFDDGAIGIEPPTMPGEGTKAERVRPEPLAILLLVIVIAGVAVSFLKGRVGMITPIIAGVIGLTLLLLLKAKIDNDVLRQGEGVLRVEYGIGFWLVLLLFLGAIGLNAFLFRQTNTGISLKGDTYGQHT